MRRVDASAQVRIMAGSLGLGALPQVDPVYRLPLYNNSASVEPTYDEMRRKIRSVIWDMEETLQQLRRVVESADPDEAFGLLETSDVHDYQGSDGNLRYGLGEATDWEFFSVVRDHRERVARLRSADLLEAFVTLWHRIDANTRRELRRRGPLRRGQTFLVALTSDEGTLAYAGLRLSRVRLQPNGDPPGFLGYLDGRPVINPGSVEVRCRLGGFPPMAISKPGRPDPPALSWPRVRGETLTLDFRCPHSRCGGPPVWRRPGLNSVLERTLGSRPHRRASRGQCCLISSQVANRESR